MDSKDIPFLELSRHIERNHDALNKIAPEKMEDLVAAVYRDVLGYSIESCSYGRADKGIDVICVQTNAAQKIAIQVKRYNSPIRLSLIHQFCGAMIESGFRKGVFVTSGRFQPGCLTTAAALENEGFEIDLVEGKRFLEFLGCLNCKRAKKICVPVWGNVVNFSGGPKEDDRWITVE